MSSMLIRVEVTNILHAPKPRAQQSRWLPEIETSLASTVPNTTSSQAEVLEARMTPKSAETVRVDVA
jgi:hypothetical protein